MKKRNKILRYSEGELVDDDDLEAQKVYNADLEELSDEERMPRSMAPVMRKAARTASARRSAVQSRERAAAPGREPPSMTESPRNAITGAGAAMDRNALTGSYRRMSDEARSGAKGRPMTEREQKAASAAGLAATLVPASRVAKGAIDVSKAAKRIRDVSQTAKAQELTAAEAARAARIRARQDMFGSGKAAREYAESGGMRRGGRVKKYAAGGSVSSASKRADGIAVRGKTRGRIF
jgi:hypothetical protein